MKVSDLIIVESVNSIDVSALVESKFIGNGSERLWFKLTGTFDVRSINIGEPFLAALLIPAMMVNEDLEIDLPVSDFLLKGAYEIQDIFYDWHRSTLSKIKIYAKPAIQQLPTDKNLKSKSASFFSGGVDSWYTFLKNRDNIQGVIIANGFDILLAEKDEWEISKKHFEDTITALNVPGHIVETNIRDIIDPKCGGFRCAFDGDAWGVLLHGGCLASVALLMQNEYSNIFISSSYSYKQLYPWGSHPLVDGKWSSESLRLIHDGCGANRMEKINYIANHKDALSHLRVCWAQHPGYLNCCRCEKCLRTMLALKVIGKLDESTAFHADFDEKYLLKSDLKKSTLLWYVDILDEARKLNNKEMIQYLEKVLCQRFSILKRSHQVIQFIYKLTNKIKIK